MNNKRISSCALVFNSNYIYVFGGRDDLDMFYDSVERYNVKMNLWN